MESNAFDVLCNYLKARAAFGPGDLDLIRSVFLFKRLSAGEFLQRAGDITRQAAFVASGCLRNYVIDSKGKEHIVQFAPETWWLADATSLNNGTPSTFFIDAIEDSEVLLIDAPSMPAVTTRHPQLLNSPPIPSSTSGSSSMTITNLSADISAGMRLVLGGSTSWVRVTAKGTVTANRDPRPTVEVRSI